MRQAVQELGQWDTKSETAGLDPAEMVRILHEGRASAENWEERQALWRDADGSMNRGLHWPRRCYRRAEADFCGLRPDFKLGLRLARTPRCLLRLDEEFLEIPHCRRVALRQFRRDPIPQRQ
jgi:hypothetical protein